jgi:hypothetical protein
MKYKCTLTKRKCAKREKMLNFSVMLNAVKHLGKLYTITEILQG